jgi:serine O-acetyltransferase
MFDRMRRDIRAVKERDPAATTTFTVVLNYPGLHAIWWHRLTRRLNDAGWCTLARTISQWVRTWTGVEIHPGATIGEGFFIDHGTGVVIGETCHIGNNVKLYQGVTLGALSFPKNERGELIRGTKRHPTVEDDVVIYAGATILGGETVVGRGSVIGGSVWLTASVPPGTRVTLQGDQLKREPRVAPVATARR